MGHGKLKKFKENEGFSCLLQPSLDDIVVKEGNGFSLRDHSVKGHWSDRFGGIHAPLVVEFGCGRGEYTIDLALRDPSRNYIGVDIKGARLWKGAKYATENNLPNVAFLRTRIEFIEAFFAKDEVSEIWLTFSDPQLKSENNRLTSPRFLERYRKFLKPGGVVHLKTDSRFLYEYSLAVCKANGLQILASTTDLYGAQNNDPASLAANLNLSDDYASVCGDSAVSALFEVQTFYEKMFMSQGYKITYLAFRLDKEGEFVAPTDFDADYWRSVEGPRAFIRNPE